MASTVTFSASEDRLQRSVSPQEPHGHQSAIQKRLERRPWITAQNGVREPRGGPLWRSASNSANAPQRFFSAKRFEALVHLRQRTGGMNPRLRGPINWVDHNATLLPKAA